MLPAAHHASVHFPPPSGPRAIKDRVQRRRQEKEGKAQVFNES